MPSKLPENGFLKLANALLFNIAWAACVLLRNEWSLVVAAAVLAFHLVFVSRYPREWLFLLIVLALGLLIDRAMVMTGLLQPLEGRIGAIVWMGALWPLFATTLNHSLLLLKHRPVAAAIVGAVAGPFAYFTAVKLGAASSAFSTSVLLGSLAGVWLLLLPGLYCLANLICPDEAAPGRV